MGKVLPFWSSEEDKLRKSIENDSTVPQVFLESILKKINKYKLDIDKILEEDFWSIFLHMKQVSNILPLDKLERERTSKIRKLAEKNYNKIDTKLNLLAKNIKNDFEDGYKEGTLSSDIEMILRVLRGPVDNRLFYENIDTIEVSLLALRKNVIIFRFDFDEEAKKKYFKIIKSDLVILNNNLGYILNYLVGNKEKNS